MGWLIFVVIGLVVTPLQVSLTIVNTHIPIFVDGTWQVLKSKTSDVYHPLWASLITFEIWGNLMIMALALTTLVFLFKRSRSTPRLAITWYSGAMMFAVADYFLALQIPASPINRPTERPSMTVFGWFFEQPCGFPILSCQNGSRPHSSADGPTKIQPRLGFGP